MLDGVKAPAWQSGRSHSQGATINLSSESITIKQSLSFQYWTYYVYYMICILCIFFEYTYIILYVDIGIEDHV